MGASQSVGPAAWPIFNQTDTEYVVQNSGTVKLYISTTIDVSPTNAHAVIGPNGDFTVPPGTTMYVCCDPNQLGAISYIDNGSKVNSGITNTQQSNAPVLLGQLVLNTPGASSSAAIALANFIDVSSYASVIVEIENPSTAGIITPGNSVKVDITQKPPGNGTFFAQSDSATWWHDGCGTGIVANGYAYVQVPVTLGLMKVALTLFSSAAPPPAVPVVAKIYGSNQVITKPIYVNSTISLNIGLPAVGFIGSTVGSGSSATLYIGSKNGPCTMLGRSATGAAAGTFQLLEWTSGIINTEMGVIQPPASLQTQQLNLFLPMAPVSLAIVTSTSGLVWALTQ